MGGLEEQMKMFTDMVNNMSDEEREQLKSLMMTMADKLKGCRSEEEAMQKLREMETDPSAFGIFPTE